MDLKNSYYYFKSALTPEQCNRIIDTGNYYIEEYKKNNIPIEAVTRGNRERGSKPNAKPINDKTISEVKDDDVYIRDSKCAFLDEKWIYDLIHPYIHKANKESGWNFDWNYSEAAQFTIYEPNGFYGWHSDSGSDWHSVYKKRIAGLTPEEDKRYVDNHNFVGKIRKLSVTINLNTPGDYEGGNLKFDFGPHTEGERYHECTQIRPQGSIIVFPSFVTHQVTPVTKGKRYSLVMWNLGRPFR
jgi:PKHD-type hydroxylase